MFVGFGLGVLIWYVFFHSNLLFLDRPLFLCIIVSCFFVKLKNSVTLTEATKHVSYGIYWIRNSFVVVASSHWEVHKNPSSLTTCDLFRLDVCMLLWKCFALWFQPILSDSTWRYVVVELHKEFLGESFILLKIKLTFKNIF